MNGNGLVAGSIQMDAAEVKVSVHDGGGRFDLDGIYFLHLSVTGGNCTLGGTLEELRQLANMIADKANGA